MVFVEHTVKKIASVSKLTCKYLVTSAVTPPNCADHAWVHFNYYFLQPFGYSQFRNYVIRFWFLSDLLVQIWNLKSTKPLSLGLFCWSVSVCKFFILWTFVTWPIVYYNTFLFKLSLCFEYCNISIGWFSSVWILCADVSEHCQFHLRRWCKQENYTIFEDGTDSVPKRHHTKFRRREITQKKE